MKKIYLTESRYKKLFEAMDDEFDAEVLKSIKSFNERVKYCKQHLGIPIGNGSSRIAFQIDDKWILKLAKNPKGIAQNEVEGQEDYYKDSLCIFPLVDYENSDTENYTFIISEYVLPAKAKDFIVCLDVTFQGWVNFVMQSASQYTRYMNGNFMAWEQFEEMMEENDTWRDLNEYLTNYQIPYGDICRLANLGMVLRDNKPQIVILDSGYNDEVARNFYKN